MSGKLKAVIIVLAVVLAVEVSAIAVCMVDFGEWLPVSVEAFVNDSGNYGDDTVPNGMLAVNRNIEDMIGRNYDEVATVWGESEDSYRWTGGNFFVFEGDVDFVFESDFESDEKPEEPEDDAVCHGALCSADKYFPGMEDREYSAEELEDALGIELKMDRIEEGGEWEADTYVYSAVKDDIEISIYSMSRKINPRDSVQLLKKA